MTAGFDAWKLSMQIIETMIASQAVIGARIGMLGKGLDGTGKMPFAEFSRLIPEKNAAFKKANDGASRAMGKRGVMPPNLSGALMSDGLAMFDWWERSLSAAGAWWVTFKMPRLPQLRRHVAVSLPAKDEEEQLPDCLTALDAAAGRYAGPVTIMVMANNCSDGTVALLRRTRLRHARLRWCALSLLPACAHAGWARRLAFDAAAELLCDGDDILASTDADTCVATDWITNMVRHFDEGVEAIAGQALTRRDDRRALGSAATDRLNRLGRYYTALDWLRADLAQVADDPWPRHFYEGGASIGLTLDLYRRIGGAPTPPLAEDRALFSAVRAIGARIRHPLDVRVFTSSRLEGRAPGGMADAFARWIAQPDDEPLHETYAFPAALNPSEAGDGDRLTFRSLLNAIGIARSIIRNRRSGSLPKIEPILVPAILLNDDDRLTQESSEFPDRSFARLGIIGLTSPVDEQHVTARGYDAAQKGCHLAEVRAVPIVDDLGQ